MMHLLHVYIDKYKCILFKTEAPLTLTTMFNSSQMILISQKLRPYQRLFYRPNIKSTEWIICFKIDLAIRNRWQNDPAAHRWWWGLAWEQYFETPSDDVKTFEIWGKKQTTFVFAITALNNCLWNYYIINNWVWESQSNNCCLFSEQYVDRKRLLDPTTKPRIRSILAKHHARLDEKFIKYVSCFGMVHKYFEWT